MQVSDRGECEVLRWIIAIIILLLPVSPAYTTEKVFRDLNTALFDEVKRGRSREFLALL